MKWDKHREYIISKTKYLLYVFAKLSRFMQTKTLLILYYALFQSVASYGILAWEGVYKNSKTILQQIQTRLVKIISKNSFLISNYPLNLDQMFAYESILYHYNNLKIIYNTRVTKPRNKSIPLVKRCKKSVTKIVMMMPSKSTTNCRKKKKYY